MKDELIRDCLVVGIEDVTLLERLQTDEALTLDKAKKLAHQREAVKEQQSILKKEETNLDYIKTKENMPGDNRRQLQKTKLMHLMWQTPSHKAELYSKRLDVL